MTESKTSTRTVSLNSEGLEATWDYDRTPHLLVTGLSEKQSTSIKDSLQNAVSAGQSDELFLVDSEESLDEIVKLTFDNANSTEYPVRFVFVDDIFLTSHHTRYTERIEKLKFLLRVGRSKNMHILVTTPQVSQLVEDVVPNVTMLDENLNCK